MQTNICLLRGINVSGKNMIKMENLRKLFENLGYKNVSTYIQSGNVIFTTNKKANEVLENEIAERILNEFGMKIPILVLKKQELEKVIANNFYSNNEQIDHTKLHVTFMSQILLTTEITNIRKGNYGGDEFKIIEKAIYLFCPNGYGNTKLNNNFFENKLKVSCTTRNWKTVNELMILANKTNI